MNGRDIVKKLFPTGVRRFLKDISCITALQGNITAFEKRINQLNERNETDIIGLQKRIDQLEERLCESRVELSELELAHGYFYGMEYIDSRLNILGWMMLPERGFDSVALYINQTKVVETEIMESDYLIKDYHYISHARKSGFSFSVHRSDEEMEGMIDICVVGLVRGRKIAKMETWYLKDLYSCFPIPPAHLILREILSEDPHFYLITGLQSYREFLTAACKYVDPLSIKSMLDWGCGCGRVIGFFSKFSGIPRLCGCDIDREAITWCRANLEPAEFSVVSPSPPTHYPDEAFDLIVSYSVLTHLSRKTQSCWLEEMQRILVPGGLFLATVHGEFAATFTFPGRKAIDVLKDGIYDDRKDEALDGVAPDGYYRSVYQSRNYTIKEYSRYFEVLEYIERGSINYQDLIVMRKKQL